MMTATHTIQDAMRAIAARCDGAATEDGQGFNGQDTVWGKGICLVPDAQWTDAHLAEAHRLLRKYRGQLAGCGVDYDTLPVPADVMGDRTLRLVDTDGKRILLRFTYSESLIYAVKDSVPHVRFDGSIKAWAAPASSRDDALAFAVNHGFAVTDAARTLEPGEAPAPTGRVDITSDQDGFVFALVFDYHPGMVADARAIPGRVWDGEHKCWTAPLDQVRAVRGFALKYGLPLTPAADAVPDCEPDTRPRVTTRAGEFVIKFGYDRDLIALVKSLPGAYWAASSKAWNVPTSAAVEVHQFLQRVECQVDDSVTPHLAIVESELAAVADSYADDADLVIPALKREPMPFQRAGMAYAIARKRTWIGDDQGLGKTLQAIGTLEALDAFPAVVIVPALVKVNWKREFAMALPHRTVHIIDGRTPYALPAADAYVLNYDIAAYWVTALQGMAGLVLDESHFVMNPKASRSTACLAIANGLQDDAPRLLLSGTASKGEAKHLVHQLRIMDRLEDFGGIHEFNRASRDRRSLPALNRRLRATCLVRRLKGDVLKDLPPRRWAKVVVDGDAHAMTEYRKAEQELLKYLAERARQAVLESGATTREAEDAAWKAMARATAAQHLVAVTTLRQLVARAKMPALREWLSSMDEKVVAFGWHTDIVDALAKDFAHGCRIQGGMTSQQRQDAVDRFQTEDSQRVIACQIVAAGVGITLTASSDVAFAEYGWTPADMDQAVDRTHRIGQTDSVTGWLFHVEDTVDDMLEAIIERKRLTTGALLDGKIGADEGPETSALSDLVEMLTAKALDNR